MEGNYSTQRKPRKNPARDPKPLYCEAKELLWAAHPAQWYVLTIIPNADGALQTTLYPVMNESKMGKYCNEPSCIPAGTQLVLTVNER